MNEQKIIETARKFLGGREPVIHYCKDCECKDECEATKQKEQGWCCTSKD